MSTIIKLHPSFGDILKKYRSKTDLSQSSVAQELGVSLNTYYNWENDKSEPSIKQIKWLMNKFSIPAHELFGMMSPSGISSDEQNMVNLYRKLSPSNKIYARHLLKSLDQAEREVQFQEASDARIILGISEQSMAAGEDQCPLIEENLVTNAVFYRRTAVNEKADVIMKVSGSSMEPNYHNGDKVYVKFADSADPGDVVFATWQNYAVIKRLGQNRMLYSDNLHEPFSMKYEHDHVKLCGIVLGRVAPEDCFSDEMQSLLFQEYGKEISAFMHEKGIPE